MANKSKAVAMVTCKCPRCREGKMFKKSPLSLNFMAMHEHCPHCGFKFEVEPAFFQGAMYVSYAFSVAMFVIVGVLTTVLLNKPEFKVYLINIVLANVLFIPFSFRYSRVLFLHLFGGVRHEPDMAKGEN